MYISTNSIRLHAKATGPEDGQPIILLHGFPEFWWGWHKQMNPLAQAGFRVVVPDQRGYNMSDRPGKIDDFAIDVLAQDILGILDYFGFRKAIIAGHDWGAAVAWYLGMYYPDRVERLIIVNVPNQISITMALKKPVWSQIKKSWYIFFFQIPYLPERLLGFDRYAPIKRVLQNTSSPGTFSKEDLCRYTEAWRRSGGLSSGINWYRAMGRLRLKLGQNAFNEKFAVRVCIPTMILWGDQDAFIEPFLADWSLEWVDNGRLVRFPTATHWILHEESERVSQEIIDFCQK